jgi:hypothetical protein
MRNLFKNKRGGALASAVAFVALVLVAMGLMLLSPHRVSGQQTNLFTNTAPNQPYFSVSNSAIIGTGTWLANEPVVAGTAAAPQTNSYVAGTNYSGGTIYPASISSSLNVAFGMVCVSTNTGALGVETVYFDEGTASGDWSALTNMSATLNGTNPVSVNGTCYVGGFVNFRVNRVKCTETNYTSTVTVGESCKTGL